jgi:alpha-L-glutamate ligase-like protein
MGSNIFQRAAAMLPWRQLHARGILGINQRNADYILLENPRRNFPLVDDKRRTKELAEAAGIAVPKLYAVVEIVHQIESMHEVLAPYNDFVIKPAHGSGGEGIVVVTECDGDFYRLSSGVALTREELEHHVANILSGMYSLGGLSDVALVEYRVDFDPIFEGVSFQGVPDIRTIVFRGIPVMAMLRLPTRLSDGKANLHQGAIGVGIDLATGRTFSGVWKDSPIEAHPDTGSGISELEIPQWETILRLTARSHDLVGLDFLGVDIVLDRKQGPLMLEMNARPGLGIQLANRQGLLSRLRRIEAMRAVPVSMDERIRLARQLV